MKKKKVRSLNFCNDIKYFLFKQCCALVKSCLSEVNAIYDLVRQIDLPKLMNLNSVCMTYLPLFE